MSDGTRVWLNARSSLNYPVAFKGGERKVSLTGEAYFEVAKNAKPFRVAVADKGMIEVLGTHFNVTAYPEQAVVKATLLEGKVKVWPLENSQLRADKARSLSPGQQALLGTGTIAVEYDVDVDAVMAWKNGKFYFENATLETILNEFSLWYDIDIIYEGKQSVKNKRFFMIMNRNVPLSEALKSLKTNDILFNIDGKKLIVK
ncbi:FecR family protein [Niabella hibiscisoli]|uniref:FecR family protein n=1 Tax=Niabella hibiscisoli TaxID=1825928 RepID=UPI001F0E99D3|nr:FecR family protein [Niabella hibiscisoli]MCH5721110.1 FecR domain-containing protein [Niabella hibiscisoli]